MEIAEIERIIDDFLTKADEMHQNACHNAHPDVLVNHYYYKGKHEALDYAAAVLKQVIVDG